MTLSHILRYRAGMGKPGSKQNSGGADKARNGGDAPDWPMIGLTVGIGASAGGLAAFKTFLANMPPDTGMAFVLVQHLDPHHPSMLVDLLAPHTAMRVAQATNGEKVGANRVYIIPPDATLTIENGTLQVTTPAPPREHRRPIDTFFASLAKDQGERAASIVLSGVGSDGTAGLRAVKASGGLTLAQAEFDETAMKGMPNSAAATGLVDHVVAVEAMPEKLVAHQEQLSATSGWRAAQASHEDWQQHLKKISALLRRGVGHDFAGYKENTLVRRVQRRMQVLQLDAVTAYIARLDADPHEADLLFRELLIGVTEFFRDLEAFDALRTTVFPSLFKDRDPDDAIRVWVPGCATGEEVYSLAILLKEAMTAEGVDLKVQIFGTDLDAAAIAVARAARYRKAGSKLSPDRLKLWFADEGDMHCPIKAVREMCIFSVHSIVKDPPFSKLDLISCRNVLIYLNGELQHRVIQTFHYALKPGAHLFLGPSEGVTRGTELFALIDKKHRILQRRDNGSSAFPGFRSVDVGDPSAPSPPRPGLVGDSIDRSARRVIEPYAPAYFVIDRNHDIVRFSGADAGQYLEPSAGAASLNLFSILRRTLRPDVRAAVLSAVVDRRGIVQQIAASGPDGQSGPLSLIVEPIEAGLFVVAFRELAVDGATESSASEAGTGSTTEQELRAAKAQIRAATSELETYMEEAKSATEEMQSVNEELQSSNEELETAKEEMQSINEELQTLNGELQSKNEALGRANDDLQNLLDSTQIATLFLDRDLRIRNFTPAMTAIFRVRDGDIGRPITDIVSRLSYEDLLRDAEEVQRTLGIVEREVRPVDGKGHAFVLRMRPYRTVDDRLDGVVLTFMDVTEMRVAQQAGEQLVSIVQSSNDAIVGKTLDGIVTSWNRSAERLFGYAADEIVGKSITLLIPPGRDDEEPSIIARIRRGEHIEHYETVRRRKDGSLVDILLSVSPIKDAGGRILGASKVAHDIGERKRAEKLLRTVMHELSHRSKNLLSVIQAMAHQTGRLSPSIESFLERFNARIQGLAASQDLLVSQDWSGARLEDLVRQQLQAFGEEDGGRVEISGPTVLVTPDAAQTLGLALHELATNASKYGALSVPQGKVAVQWNIEPGSGSPRFRMSWRERGGPRVNAPERSGFGRMLIERLTAEKLEATVLLAFERDGVMWTLDAAAKDVLAGVSPDKGQ
jgi:two-component system, chemotaxis family, CheB/CheR fusion protein